MSPTNRREITLPRNGCLCRELGCISLLGIRGAIVTHVDGEEVPSLDAFYNVLKA